MQRTAHKRTQCVCACKSEYENGIQQMRQSSNPLSFYGCTMDVSNDIIVLFLHNYISTRFVQLCLLSFFFDNVYLHCVASVFNINTDSNFNSQPNSQNAIHMRKKTIALRLRRLQMFICAVYIFLISFVS